ncbi:MAG TPA: tripartite tricarboxylate transporter TctB family protein [Alphaproteobacteria bacterium]|nr:tripartite tricarboxylate transporter TctB family protein [Alphaproteobacteria bacterium]
MPNSTPRDGGREIVGGDLVLPGLAVAFTAYFFYSVWDLSWEAKANATIIGVTLLVLIGMFVIRATLKVMRDGAGIGLESLFEPRSALGPRLSVVAFTALFVVVLPWLGLTLGLFALVAGLMLVLRAGSWRAVVATSATVSMVAYLLFIALLNSRLPRGPIEKLLAALF